MLAQIKLYIAAIHTRRVSHTKSQRGLPDERVQLLEWLKAELKRRRIGSTRLLAFMDDNRSNCASFFSEFHVRAPVGGHRLVLYRAEYMRLFKAVDRSVAVLELKAMLRGEGGEVMTKSAGDGSVWQRLYTSSVRGDTSRRRE